ncbi:hypothetical protein NDU88_008608 [Pleurodeles waltl]|uniref:Myb/SANT-like DNA-binding domain-containing protein n=1 Tax=Pleurodeles waltl TaxID=8319 RepID=A0AAV7NWI8_PLEWA|nr:hypothetical protein NDU88_008608 [Pleurodeles waltl]
MAAATGERAPAFTSEELEKLVDGVLPQYALLYGPPDQQVSAHQKIDIWRAIAKEVRALGVYTRRGTHCRKRWEDIRRGTRKTAESLLRMASRPRRGASRTLTPLMSRILAVAYPDLDGRLRTSQQTQGGGGDLASEHEGAASHKAPVGTGTDTEGTSDPEGEGSTTTGTGEDNSDTDTSSVGSSLAVAATSGPPASTGTAATQRTSTALPAAPQPSLRARSPRKAGVSFGPGTSAPAPVTPAALSEEVIDLLQTIIVGQTTLLNAIQGVEREVHRSNAYLEGIHSGQAAHQRSFNALASALTAAIVPVSSLPLLTASTLSLSPGGRHLKDELEEGEGEALAQVEDDGEDGEDLNPNSLYPLHQCEVIEVTVADFPTNKVAANLKDDLGLLSLEEILESDVAYLSDQLLPAEDTPKGS